MSVALDHFIDVDTEEVEVGVNRYRAICDCGFTGSWREEFWQADDDAWYHSDYPDGE